jgi:hypothetical protein
MGMGMGWLAEGRIWDVGLPRVEFRSLGAGGGGVPAEPRENRSGNVDVCQPVNGNATPNGN